MYGVVLLPSKKIWIVPSKHLWTSDFNEAGHRIGLVKGSSIPHMVQQELIGIVEFCDHIVISRCITKIFIGNNRISGITEFGFQKGLRLLMQVL